MKKSTRKKMRREEKRTCTQTQTGDDFNICDAEREIERDADVFLTGTLAPRAA